jgi:CRP-like cAMP-binding protein
LDWSSFGSVTFERTEAAFTRFRHSSVKYWYHLFRRTSGLLDLDLHERLALTILGLSEDFGIADARGTMLGIPISHEELASIIGASRPRITAHLAQMERDQMIIRQGRQFIVNTAELWRSLTTRSI